MGKFLEASPSSSKIIRGNPDDKYQITDIERRYSVLPHTAWLEAVAGSLKIGDEVELTNYNDTKKKYIVKQLGKISSQMIGSPHHYYNVSPLEQENDLDIQEVYIEKV